MVIFLIGHIRAFRSWPVRWSESDPYPSIHWPKVDQVLIRVFTWCYRYPIIGFSDPIQNLSYKWHSKGNPVISFDDRLPCISLVGRQSLTSSSMSGLSWFTSSNPTEVLLYFCRMTEVYNKLCQKEVPTPSPCLGVGKVIIFFVKRKKSFSK